MAFASASFAADYTYDAVSSTTAKSFEEIANAVGAPAFDASTNLTINITKDSADWFLTTSANTILNSFTIKSTGVRFEMRESSTFSTVGNFSVTTSAQYGSQFLNGTLNVGGDFISADSTAGGFCFGHANNGTMKQLIVNGNISGKISQMRVGKTPSAAYDSARWNSADVKVGGILASTTSLTFYYTSNSENGHYYYQFGGINQSQAINFTSRVASASVQAYANVMLTGSASTNAGVATFSGSIKEIHDPDANAPKVSFFMNSSDGAFTQKFTSGTLNFTGGVTVQSGTLLVNYAETSGANHGNLTMLGGKFGNSNANAGAFQFSDIVYSGGTIALTLRNVDNFDKLNLSGTIKLAEGSSAKVVFDFGDNLKWLIGSEENGGLGVKIISWSVQSALDATSFFAKGFSNSGEDYAADFTSTADGLYVKYTAVPEASAIAAILGFVALGFAAYRRRK